MISSSSSTDQDNIRELAEALRQVDLAQDRVTAVLQRLTREETRRINLAPNPRASGRRVRAVHTVPEDQDAESENHEPFVLPNSNLRVGDRVRIINPGAQQQDRGIIVGPARRRGFVLVRTANGDIILRIPRNLQVISTAAPTY